MKSTDTSYVIVGKFGSTYGVHGWIKIHTYTEFGANILEYQPWYINRKNDPGKNNLWTPIAIESGRLHNNGIIVKLNGINTPEEVRLFTGLTIAITRSQLPQLSENEY